MQLSGESFIGVVAQQPFEVRSAADTYNSFCTIEPIAFQDGRRTTPDQFPNCGLVWWMLRPNAHHFALPGRLLSFVIEEALEPKLGDPIGNMYQAVRASVEPCKLDDVVEVLTVPAVSIERPSDLISRPGLITTDHPPGSMVLARWQGSLYGPLRTTLAERGEDGQFPVTFSAPGAGQAVLKIPDENLDSLLAVAERLFQAEIAQDQHHRHQSQKCVVCEYELITAAIYEQLGEGVEDRILLRSDADVLRGAAKALFTRKKRQELTALLKELEIGLGEIEEGLADERTQEVLDAVVRAVTADEGQGAVLAEALIESGLIDEQVRSSIERQVEELIDTRAASLKAEIEEKVEKVRQELEGLGQQRKQQSAEIESRARQAKVALDRELAMARKDQEESLLEEQAHLERREATLDREKEQLEKRLEEVMRRFSSAREDVVNDFLTLEPLLSRAGFLAGPHAPEGGTVARETVPEEKRSFVLHSYLSIEADPPSSATLSEMEFFNRFVSHTEVSGFAYRGVDLKAFHISAKACDLTVLGGVSGTGKTSLPRLYAEALAGEDPAGTSRFRTVGVNPSWLDVGDLLGRVNMLDAKFQPSESGLYQLLIHAHEEYRRWAEESGLYVVCLDEMNLAHVEHYFSPFLGLLESPHEHRKLQVFSREVVSPDSGFWKWPRVDLPPSLRFVGTVNFDETTRPLSLRVLDRVNLIKLRPGRLSSLDLSAGHPEVGAVAGPPVTSAVFESWVRNAQPGRDVAEVLDSLRGPLATLGCPLSPRRYRSLCRFLASSPAELLAPLQSLDLQIAQRLLPQIRGLFRREAQEAVEELIALLEKKGETFAESLQGLDELRGDEYQMAPVLPDES